MMVIDNIISRFFIGKDFRIYRHMVLLLLIVVITINFIWYLPVKNVPEYYKIYAWNIYFIAFVGIIYHNLYFAAPDMLLKNKISKYVLTLVIYVVVILLCVMFAQYCLLKMNWTRVYSPEAIFINLFSTTLVLIFLFTGTTSILLVKHRIKSDREKSELESSILESELKLLKNQVNPHFLFNMLNNANMLLKKDKKQASDVLFKLEDLLRYQIHDNVKEDVNLDSEINFLNDYLNLEKIRRDNFNYSISEQGDCRHQRVSPLLFIVFVENAVKHNADNENESYVNILFKYSENKLEFVCENSKPRFEIKSDGAGGLGLKNIDRRLDLLYPDRHKLEIISEELKYIVKLTLIL